MMARSEGVSFLIHLENQNCDNDKKSDQKSFVKLDHFWVEYFRVVLTDHCCGEVVSLLSDITTHKYATFKSAE